MKRLFISVKSLSDKDKFPILISHYDESDAEHTSGDTEHLESLIEQSIEDGDYSLKDARKELAIITNYDYVTVGE